MRGILIPFLLSIVGATVAEACSCVNTGTPCSSFAGTEVVFLGRVIQDSGEGIGKGPARLVIEQLFHGLPKDTREVEVSTSAGTSCYRRLAKDERYVVFASRFQGQLSSGGCSLTFNVRGNERLLDGLRQVHIGGPPKLVGKVHARSGQYDWEPNGPAGVTIVAERAGAKYETKTGSDGQFEFVALDPGEYKLTVPSPDYFVDPSDYLSPKTFNVPASGCADGSLYVWQNGKISGSVRSEDGKPIKGVPVQVFAFDKQNKLETRALRDAKTDDDGRYEIQGLPAGDYVIGVNAEKYSDRLAFKPTVYPGRGNRDDAMRIHLAAAQLRSGVDLTLEAPREKAVLVIEFVYQDGSPAIGAGGRIENLMDVQRFNSGDRDEKTSVRRVDVYRGEIYQVKGFNVKSSLLPTGKMSIITWEGKSGPIPMDAPEKQIKVILHECQSVGKCN